jgi:ATP-dependent RNA helicase DDX31/DBP7
MTKIQKKAIPILLEHKNVIVKSETGSGKTLAYVIPLYQSLIEINEVSKINRKDGIYSIIFSPTHELCLQIEKTFDKLKSCCINVIFGAMMGGQKIDTEKKKLRKGINVIISTPGRLLYHLRNTGNLNFSKLKTIIIDEADLMLDMGFEKDIKECFKLILKKSESDENEMFNNVEDIQLNPDLFKKYKIFLISATIDNKIRKMSNYFMKGFKAIGFEKEDNDKKEENEENKKDDENNDINDIEKENEKYNINKTNYLSSLKQQNITQFYSCIYDEYRLVHLIAFLYNTFQQKTIIFVSTCDLCEYLSKLITEIEIDINYEQNQKIIKDKSNPNSKKELSEKNINLFSQKTYKLHGKMKHDERKIVFNDFNEDNTGILIATDVASRGLDFKDVDWIIHYDVNPDIKEYVNRIGRTARIDNTGNSILFLMKNEMKLLDTCFISVKNNLNEMTNSDILVNFTKNINKNILKTKISENFPDVKNEEENLDDNELYKKKYQSILNVLIRCIKNFVFKDKTNLVLARKAFKSEVRAYATFFKYGKDIFNVNTLNLTRISRSFGLYKESLSMKVGEDQVNINYQIDRKEKFTQKKFLNKKIQNKLIYSEFE